MVYHDWLSLATLRLSPDIHWFDFRFGSIPGDAEAMNRFHSFLEDKKTEGVSVFTSVHQNSGMVRQDFRMCSWFVCDLFPLLSLSLSIRVFLIIGPFLIPI